MNNTIQEQGAAEITVTLQNGEIVVRHPDGTILHEVKAKKGDWMKLWRTLENLG